MKAKNLRQVQIQQHHELRTLFHQQHEYKRRAYPEWATYDGDHRYDDQLTDLSHEAAGARCQKNQHFLRHLKALNPEWLSPQDLTHSRLFAQMLELEIRHHQLGLHLLEIDQQEGMHLKFPQLVEIQPLESYNHYQQYFSRLRGFGRQVDDTLENLRLGLSRQLTLPRQVVEQSLGQMAELADCPLEQMPLYQPVLQHAQSLPPELAQKVEELARRTITEQVQPAYLRLHNFVRDTYLPHCRSDQPGLCGLPDGETLYAYWVERHTMAGMSPQGIHELGLSEVERLHAAIEPLRQQLGLSADWASLQAFLRQDPSLFYSQPEAMMKDYAQMLADANLALPKLFDRLPQSACVLKEIEAWRAAAAPQAYYYPPPQDLSRPGIYYVNTYDLPARPRFTMMALTLHEAVPGHHLQLARALETPALPDFRYHLEATAFVEGWALYAEALGHELGLYGDPLQALGALALELWRACRLVVDTGLHAFGWSREQAVSYFRQHSLQSETDIQSEIDRYLALPGQALAYKVGEQQILAWRREAQTHLGSHFQLPAFHELMLGSGSVPLGEKAHEFKLWMQQRQAA